MNKSKKVLLSDIGLEIAGKKQMFKTVIGIVRMSNLKYKPVGNASEVDGLN